MYEIDQFTPAFIACLSSVKCLQRMNKENAHSTELSVTTILISTWCNTWPWLISSLNLPVDDYLRESICAPYTLSSCSYPNNSSPTKTHPSHPIMRILPGSPQKHRSQSGNYHFLLLSFKLSTPSNEPRKKVHESVGYLLVGGRTSLPWLLDQPTTGLRCTKKGWLLWPSSWFLGLGSCLVCFLMALKP